MTPASATVYACISPHPPVLLPAVGGGRERITQRTIDALRQVSQELSQHAPETVVLIATHGPIRLHAFGILTSPTAYGDMAPWGAPQVSLSCQTDTEVVAAIYEAAQAAGVPLRPITRWNEGRLDWSCMVPLYYLRPGLSADTRFVFVNISLLPLTDHFAFGQAIGQALTRLDRPIAIIASADMAHCLTEDAPQEYHPAGPIFEDRIHDAIARWDVETVLSTDDELRDLANEDATPSISILMGALDGLDVRPRILSHEWPFGVGYMVAAIDIIRG